MRLAEALKIVAQTVGERQRQVHLLCGFTSLHLATFVRAHMRLRFPEDRVCLQTGLYGDLEGNVRRAAELSAEGAIVVFEWGDLDQRLGLRNSAGWGAQTLEDIPVQIEEKCWRIEKHLDALAKVMPVAVIAPTFSLPPLTHLPPLQTSDLELHLDAILLDFMRRVCARKGVKPLSASFLALSSPHHTRHDIKADLQLGFPYTLAHADALAQLSVSCLFAPVSKKGLITDLDDTLWKGILGEDGVEGVSWSLEEKSQAHGLYQQVLASLAESGVMVAVASKNDLKLVDAAFQRPDILLKPSQIFPVEADWNAKSDAVGHILRAWNVGADSVVFVDDSRMELAEVSEKHPGIECLHFPTNDPAGIFGLLLQLRNRFGREEVREEDHLRLQSLRAAAQHERESEGQASEDFLARIQAKLTFEISAADDARAFELVNKTNQFNLNGVRYTEAEWKSRIRRPGSFLTTVAYEDRFGPLGRIAVVGGCIDGDQCVVDIWVMSCRAFSRNIEFQVLRRLFERSAVSVVQFRFRPTERNGPIQNFFGYFFPPKSTAEDELNLPAARFQELCPPLFHQVIEK
jgi:FkbH-like protein